jgi:hypothetical protein
MASLTVSIAPASGISVPKDAGPFLVDVTFTQAIPAASGTTKDLPASVQDTVRIPLDAELQGQIVLSDLQASSTLALAFLSGSGATRLRKTVAVGRADSATVSLSAADVKIIAAPEAQPPPAPPQTYRQAYFVQVSGPPVAFDSSRLQIAPVRLANGGWSRLGLQQIFNTEAARTSSVPWLSEHLAVTTVLDWAAFHVGVDGQFNFNANADSGDAWLWWLSGPMPAIGVVLDDLSVPRVSRIAVALPPFATSGAGEAASTGVPPVFTESEVANNPHVYTEDPGSFCQPFKNPERVLGERSFFVIMRAEQPVISAEATVKKDPLSVLTAATSVKPAAELPRATARTARARATAAAAAASAKVASVASGAIVSGVKDMLFERHTLPAAYLDLLQSFDRGRGEANAKHPIQWESDTSRYQAATVARGHIIELRMRWRSNGYSLGTVQKTLTLAPRQAKRIEKVEWRRSERNERRESTQLADRVSDSVNQERAYDDSVSANLSEWERGSSSSSMQSGAGGFGFVLPGFIAGGGGGASHASSESSQQGGRTTSASEEQRLRDSIRRYGESLRKLDSFVVNEVTQEETVTGTTEVVRNANYMHSLTVIYYQILRHLKIETAVAGVRECLFVPFAISPFTLPRAYRWRESIAKALRDPQYAGALRYLHDVLTSFSNSSVPAGRRSDQPVRFVHGSVFIKMAIDRPANKSDGAFDVLKWSPLQPFLVTPALGIFSLLNKLTEEERDAAFQRDHAPGIAANWVNKLQLKVGGKVVNADFTLATRYAFNGTVRVDFRAAIPEPTGVTRESFASTQIKALLPLPPGSIANVSNLSFTYQTDTFERSVAGSDGIDDLILPQTGAVDGNGALLSFMPDAWERRNVRAEMIDAVQALIGHLNEHVEWYHKAIWWAMDRDRLFMLIDGFYAPGTNGLSIASVVERDPIAIIGNSLVYRVANGAFLGLGSIKTPADLYNFYVAKQAVSDPMLVSLPTDGLYAQTVMDDCPALEEHYGNHDWVLNDPDLSLGEISPELLASRRAEPTPATPTPFPGTLINLQNAPAMPAPTGLASVLSTVGNPNAFRDMAGLAGTQQNAAAAFAQASDLAKNFGNQAAAIKLAEMAKDAHSTQTADQKLATVQRAQDKNLITPEVAQDQAKQILESLHKPDSSSPGDQRDAAVTHAVQVAADSGQPFSVEHTTTDGTTTVTGGNGAGAPSWIDDVALFPEFAAADFERADAKLLEFFDLVKQHNDTNLCIALVDLTGDPAKPRYVGMNDDQMIYPGSMAKIAVLFAAFALKKQIQEIVNGIPTGGPKTAKALFPLIEANWGPKLKALFPGRPEKGYGLGRSMISPDLATILKISSTGIVAFNTAFQHWLEGMAVMSNNYSASLVIDAIGYFYINNLLANAGLFRASDPTDGTGLWISGDYEGHDWVSNTTDKANNAAGPKLFPFWAEHQPDGGKPRTHGNFVVTASDTATLMTFMARGQLVDPESSEAMADLLSRSRTGAGSIIQSIFNRQDPKIAVDFMAPKVGIGNDVSYHECAFIRRTTVADKQIQYVLVVLGSQKVNYPGDFETAVLECDAAVQDRNA